MYRVLVADDDAMITRLALEILEEAGYTATVVRTGRELYNLATACRDLYDVIVVDIRMPEWNGYSSMETARGFGVDTPTLFVTADPEFDKHIEENSRLKILSKPFTASSLLSSVGELLKTGLKENE